MKIVLAVVAIIALSGWYLAKAQHRSKIKALVSNVQFPITESPEGLRTSRVIATYRKNDAMGQFVKLEYPKNVYDCDRAEISDFIEAHDGWVFQGGGSPGAAMYVKFKDAKDKEAIGPKVREILPALSQLMQNISLGIKIEPIVNPNAKQWPDTDPPDKANPYWEFNNNLGVNGTQYKKAEVAPGKWQWVVDEKSMKAKADYANHKRALWRALTSRVLTDAELKEAVNYGTFLNVEEMVSYSGEEKSQELTRAFMVQRMLRESISGTRSEKRIAREQGH